MSTEIEAKFVVTGRGMPDRIRALRTIGSYTLLDGFTETSLDVYLDTADRSLLSAGYVCRRREREGALLISVKETAPGRGPVHRREELEVSIPHDSPPDGWPESEAREKILGLIGAKVLQEMLRLRQSRLVRRVVDGQRHVADCSLDDVRVGEGASEYRWHELEIELAPGGTEADLAALSGWVRASLGLNASSGSKFETALDAVSGGPRGRGEPRAAARRAAASPSSESVVVIEAPDEFSGGLPLSALAALGYTASAGRRFQDRLTFFDTHDGAFLKLGMTILYSASSSRWSALEGDEVKAEQDTPPSSPAREDAPAGNMPSVPYLEAALEEIEYKVGGLVAHQLQVRAQAWTFRVPGEESSPQPFYRLVVSGPSTGCAYFSSLLQSSLGCRISTQPLVERGLALLGTTRPGAPLPAEFRVHAEDTVGQACARILRGEAWKMRANVRGAIHDLDSEFVHDLRVATRRARSALRLFSRVFEPEGSRFLAGELAWIAALLGATRDLDVLLSRLAGHFHRVEASSTFRETIEGQLRVRRGRSLSGLVPALQSERFPRLLSRLETWVYSPMASRAPETPVEGPGAPAGEELAAPDDVPGDRPARRFARVRIDRIFAKLALWVDRPPESLTDTELHRIRILFKRLRYACEFFRPVLGDDAGELIGSFVGFQDCLGLHQDAVTALRLLADTLAEVPDHLRSEGFLLSAGALFQVQRDIQAAQRERFARRWKTASQLIALWKTLRIGLGEPA